MSNIKLDAQVRTVKGKNRTIKIRADKNIPAAIFSKGQETEMITISARDFEAVYSQAGYTSIVDVNVEGKVCPTVIKEIDRHPFKNQILHVNFQGVKMDEAIKVELPIDFINKDSIREQPSVFTQTLTTVHIECLPGDIPEAASIDVADMKIDETFKVSDLDIAKNGKITILTDKDEVICVLSHEHAAEEEQPTEAVEAAEEA